MVIVADDAPAAEACLVNPVALGMRNARIKFGSRKHNPAWSLSVAQLVVELTVSRRANDTGVNFYGVVSVSQVNRSKVAVFCCQL